MAVSERIIDEMLIEQGYDPSIPDIQSLRVAAQLRSIAESGEYFLNDVAGAELDFTADLNAKQLLLAYARYAFSQRENLFSVEYQPELLALNCAYMKGGEDSGEE